MHTYQELILDTLENGMERSNRTGVATTGVFGRFWRHDMKKGFPILTTKKIHYRSVVEELLWFLRGSTNIKDLKASIWNEWADNDGELGPVYGAQWRRAAGVNDRKEYVAIDQIANLLHLLKSDPWSRRMMVNAWNPSQLGYMRLVPCHFAFQVYADPQQQRLSLHFHQRSVDLFLGFPFNIASYATLLLILSTYMGYEPWELCASLGDVHLYHNHLAQARTILERKPFPLPHVHLTRPIASLKDIEMLTFEDFKLENYQSHPKLAADIAV